MIRAILIVALASSFATGCGDVGSGGAETKAPRPTTDSQEHQIVTDTKEGAEWIAEAMRSSGYATDFSPSSLWEVDRFFAEQMERAGKPKRRGLLAEQRGSRLFAIGGYIGEVIRRNATGWKWVPAKDDPNDELNLSLVHEDGAVIWPIQRSVKRFAEGEENGIATYAMTAADLDVGSPPK